MLLVIFSVISAILLRVNNTTYLIDTYFMIGNATVIKPQEYR